MITKLKVRNFQSLVGVDLDLGLVTAITGESDNGKSAVVRALESVFKNRSGDTFITHGKTACSVAVVADGQSIVWDKGPGVNQYTLEGVEYQKVGRGGVPPEVLTLLNISDENVAGQFDRPYLLFETGSFISDILGRVTNVGLLYEAVRLAGKDIKRLDKEISTLQTDIAFLEVSRDKMKPLVEELLSCVADLEEQDQSISDSEGRLATLGTQLVRLSEYQSFLSGMAEVTEVAAKLTVIDRAVGVFGDTTQQFVDLFALIANREALTRKLEQWKDLPVLPNMDAYELLQQEFNALQSLVLDHTLQFDVASQAALKADELSMEYDLAYKEFVENLSEFDVCPLSGGALFEDCKLLLKEVE